MVALLSLAVMFGALSAPIVSREPLLVTISADGAGDAAEVRWWTDLATAHNAHFTYFLSGVYLLAGDQAARYRPPQHRAGASDMDSRSPAMAATSARRSATSSTRSTMRAPAAWTWQRISIAT